MKKRVIAVVLAALLCVLSTMPVCAVGKADLTVTKITWTGNDGQVAPKTELEISVAVKNEGTAAVTKPFAVEVKFGTNVILRAKHTETLAAGKTATVKMGSVLMAAGDRMVSARVDVDGAIDEVSEKNNTMQRNLRVANDRLTPAYNADVVGDDYRRRLTAVFLKLTRNY